MDWWETGWVRPLAADFRCLLVDPPGMGGSGTPPRAESYNVDAIAGDVLALADALALERFAVWGASAGGGVGIVLAVRHPDRVAALVVSGFCPPEDASELRRRWVEFAEVLRREGTVAFIAALLEAEGSEPPARPVPYESNREVVARILEGLGAFAWEEHARPAQIGVPTLLIVDELANQDGQAERAAEQMPQGELVVLPGRGHVGAWPFSPVDSIAAARPFLDRVTSAAATSA